MIALAFFFGLVIGVTLGVGLVIWFVAAAPRPEDL